MGKVITKNYQDEKFGIVSQKTMKKILAMKAEQAQRRAATAPKVADAEPSKKARGSRAKPKIALEETPDKEQEVSDAPE